jgi:hypothetical protein
MIIATTRNLRFNVLGVKLINFPAGKWRRRELIPANRNAGVDLEKEERAGCNIKCQSEGIDFEWIFEGRMIRKESKEVRY